MDERIFRHNISNDTPIQNNQWQQTYEMSSQQPTMTAIKRQFLTRISPDLTSQWSRIPPDMKSIGRRHGHCHKPGHCDTLRHNVTTVKAQCDNRLLLLLLFNGSLSIVLRSGRLSLLRYCLDKRKELSLSLTHTHTHTHTYKLLLYIR